MTMRLKTILIFFSLSILQCAQNKMQSEYGALLNRGSDILISMANGLHEAETAEEAATILNKSARQTEKLLSIKSELEKKYPEARQVDFKNRLPEMIPEEFSRFSRAFKQAYNTGANISKKFSHNKEYREASKYAWTILLKL